MAEFARVVGQCPCINVSQQRRWLSLPGNVQQLGDNKLQIRFDTDGELWLSLLE
jgi:hypothetical protein